MGKVTKPKQTKKQFYRASQCIVTSWKKIFAHKLQTQGISVCLCIYKNLSKV